MSKKEVNNSNSVNIVISIDPGREKCGVAVVGKPDIVIHKAVVATEELIEVVGDLQRQYDTYKIVLGNGTSSDKLAKLLQTTNKAWDIVSMDEYRTTDMARIRYWRENPPKGWRRLVPVTMQIIPVPVDDYVAVILAEKYFGIYG